MVVDIMNVLPGNCRGTLVDQFIQYDPILSLIDMAARLLFSVFKQQ